MIRDARFSDLKELASLCEEARRCSKYAAASEPLDELVSKTKLMEAIFEQVKGEAKLLVLEEDGVLQGFFLGKLQPHYLATSIVTAHGVIWHASPGVSAVRSMGLMTAFMEWAKGAGADLTRLALTDAFGTAEAAARVVEKKLGFCRIGVVMEKEM